MNTSKKNAIEKWLIIFPACLKNRQSNYLRSYFSSENLLGFNVNSRSSKEDKVEVPKKTNTEEKSSHQASYGVTPPPDSYIYWHCEFLNLLFQPSTVHEPRTSRLRWRLLALIFGGISLGFSLRGELLRAPTKAVRLPNLDVSDLTGRTNEELQYSWKRLESILILKPRGYYQNWSHWS